MLRQQLAAMLDSEKNRCVLRRARAEVAAVRTPFGTLDGDTFRDNRGDNAGLVNRDVVYTQRSHRGEVAEWPKAAVC